MERNKKVQMSMSALAEMIKKHYGLPPDAIYQGSEYDASRDAMTVMLKHQTFDMVKEPEIANLDDTSTVPEPGVSESSEKSISDSGAEGSESFEKWGKKKNG